MFARFDENPAMTLRDIKETNCYGRTYGRTHGGMDRRTHNLKTVYPPQTKFAGGYKYPPQTKFARIVREADYSTAVALFML